jgi:hypothetical protein
LGSGKQDVAEERLVVVCRHTNEASVLAPPSGDEPLDVHGSRRSSPNQSGVRALIVPLTRENPRWGYVRIVGKLKSLRVTVSATMVKKVLRQEQPGPAGTRKGPSWREFLHAQANFTVATVWLQRLHVLFFIEIASRRVYLVACTAHPKANGRLSRRGTSHGCSPSVPTRSGS